MNSLETFDKGMEIDFQDYIVHKLAKGENINIKLLEELRQRWKVNKKQ